MCSNYLPASPPALGVFGRGTPAFAYGGECFPQRVAPFLAGAGEAWRPGVFGLLPHWGKPELARHTYNARSETVATLPSFRAAWRRRQLAVIPMVAFFEPDWSTGRAVRWRIERQDGQPFGVAGIWEERYLEDGKVQWSFSMLTINADGHPLMSRFHAPGKEKRSVVVLAETDWDAWLGGRDEGELRALLRPFSAEEMRAEADPRGATGRD
jgi:putative SOS response-associated peptidase YedK